MRALEGEQTRMRIYLSESDKAHGRPLYRELMDLLRKHKLAGATLTRGIEGFGAKSHMHSARLLSLSQDLPLLIEVVDTPGHIEAVLPEIDAIIQEGLVTLEKVHVLRYAPKQRRPDAEEKK